MRLPRALDVRATASACSTKEPATTGAACERSTDEGSVTTIVSGASMERAGKRGSVTRSDTSPRRSGALPWLPPPPGRALVRRLLRDEAGDEVGAAEAAHANLADEGVGEEVDGEGDVFAALALGGLGGGRRPACAACARAGRAPTG